MSTTISEKKSKKMIEKSGDAAPAPKRAKKSKAAPAAPAAVEAEAAVEAPPSVTPVVMEEQAMAPESEEDGLVTEVEGADEMVVVEEEESGVGGSKKRVAITRETVIENFDNLINAFTEEINNMKGESKKSRGIKFLRSSLKAVMLLKNQSGRLMKKKVKGDINKVASTNSGFLKPVKISKQMATFTGWNPNEKKSRVDVTKFLCEYIKANNLQNANDKREINPDAKLKKLLGIETVDPSDPLTYYKLQSAIKPHFIKDA
jgi:chromatin remodeling complex protein RSC6